ncbi:hypothetical protein ES703_69406 [subsurface metagenome]
MKLVFAMFSKNNTDRYIPDFNIMIKIAILNSLGFFFMGFLIPVINNHAWDCLSKDFFVKSKLIYFL